MLPTVLRLSGEQLVMLGASVASLVPGFVVSLLTRSRPPQTAYWQPSASEAGLRDHTLISVHNADSLSENGNWFFAENQHLTSDVILEETPVRRFHIDVYERDGELVLNHGGLWNLAYPSYPLDAFLEVINTHLLRHPRDFITLDFEEYVDPSNITTRLESVFGDRIWTLGDQLRWFSEHQRLPRIRELTSNDEQLLIFGVSSSSAAPELDDISHCDWESRSVVGALGWTFHQQIRRRLSVADVDVLSDENRVCLALDHLSANDPRLLKPEFRSSTQALAFPEIGAFGGTAFFADPLQARFIYGTGISLASATMIFGGVEVIYLLRENERELFGIHQLWADEVNTISIEHLYQYKMTSPTSHGRALGELATKKLASRIRMDAFAPIFRTAITSSGTLISFAFLLPLYSDALFLSAIAALGFGGAAGVGYALIQEYRMRQRLDPLLTFHFPLLEARARDLARGNTPVYQSKPSPESPFRAIVDLLFVSKTLLRITAISKYSLSLIAKISGGLLSGVVIVAVIYDAIKSHLTISREETPNVSDRLSYPLKFDLNSENRTAGFRAVLRGIERYAKKNAPNEKFSEMPPPKFHDITMGYLKERAMQRADRDLRWRAIVMMMRLALATAATAPFFSEHSAHIYIGVLALVVFGGLGMAWLIHCQKRGLSRRIDEAIAAPTPGLDDAVSIFEQLRTRDDIDLQLRNFQTFKSHKSQDFGGSSSSQVIELHEYASLPTLDGGSPTSEVPPAIP